MYTRLVSSLTSRVHDLEETIDEMRRELKDDAQQSENRISAALAKIKPTSPKPKNQHNHSMPVQSEKVTPRSGSKPTPVSEKTEVEEKGNEEPAPTGALDRSDRNQHEVHGDANDRKNHTDVSEDETPTKPPGLASSSQARKTNDHQWLLRVNSVVSSHVQM